MAEFTTSTGSDVRNVDRRAVRQDEGGMDDNDDGVDLLKITTRLGVPSHGHCSGTPIRLGSGFPTFGKGGPDRVAPAQHRRERVLT